MNAAVDPQQESPPVVLVGVAGRTMRVRLNRPRALNALTLEMVRDIDAALDRAAAEPTVEAVVLEGEGDRAFCAGGDIRAFYDAAIVGSRAPQNFWAEEYRLNLRIARFAKPIVAVMHGIVMGGGVGLAGHASHRVVTDTSAVAMPEVGIGFAPDVGGTWLLTRRPGGLGIHAALTTARLNAADSIEVGLADHFVPVAQIPSLIDALASEPLDDALRRYTVDPPPPALARPDHASWMNDAYQFDTVPEIVAFLRAAGSDAAANAAAEIERQSPTSLAVTLKALRSAQEMPSLERCLEQDFRISRTFLTEVADFVEGIRAAVVDKDRTPKWSPGQHDQVTTESIERFFARRDDDLKLDEIDGP